MKTFLLVTLILLGCDGEPPSEMDRAGAKSKSGFLFELDDCRVYRFYDEYRYHYFVRCPDSASTSETLSERQGKHQVQRDETIPTVPR